METHLRGKVSEEIPEDLSEIRLVTGEAGRQLDRSLAVQGQLDPGRVGEVVDHMAIPERDATHGVGDVLVEPGEESEAVLAGQVAVRPLDIGARRSRSTHRDRDAASFSPAQLRLSLEDSHAEPPLDQLVCGAHPGHTATQDHHLGALPVGCERLHVSRLDM
jgi:hypothetical protein